MLWSRRTSDTEAKLAALDRAQAIIEFDLSGNILAANANFLAAMGYTLDEIVGKHHCMFVEPAYKESAEYKAFWDGLRRGEHKAAQYRRFGKGGREIWIEASYNPVLGRNGKPRKVVKFATDITAQVQLLNELRGLIDRNFAEIDQAVARSTGEVEAAASSAQETSGSVQTMSAATQQLANSVEEISAGIARSRMATDSTFEQADAAGAYTKRLSDAASAMGGIVGLIQNIAGQINLLALNATIESARAGEAGRGFAVVAQEVKNLASQAAQATDQISAEIDGVQKIADQVVGALASIRGAVETMREHAAATSAAVEEQSAVTRDMSRNMQEAARAVGAISDNMAAISASVTQVSGAVATTREAARVLAR
jgi:methyl-accepting chemotaxis protein